MLFINYKGNTPQQRFYSFAVQGNNCANIVAFVLQKHQVGVDLSDFICNLKIRYKDTPLSDIEELFGVYDENSDTITFEWSMTSKDTKYRNIELQLEFISEDEVVWQTQIVELELSDTISVGDEKPSEKELSLLKQIEVQVGKCEEDIEELKGKKDIVIGNPSDYENENGVDKIIRPTDTNGDIEKSFVIDKKFKENTLVQAIANTEDYENGELVDADNISIIDICGENFDTIFGDDYTIDEEVSNYVVNYDQNGTKTYGIRFGNNGDFGDLVLVDCIPNKVIRVIVGKYFEYDEHGNKVFDEHCAIYSDNFIDEYGALWYGSKEITEERQVFELKTDDSGRLYFDSDSDALGFSNTRFILYGFEIGEPEHIEYHKNEINTGVKFLPIFKSSTKGQEIIDYWQAHKDELECGDFLSFALMEDENVEYMLISAYFNIGGDEIELTSVVISSRSFTINSFSLDFFKIRTLEQLMNETTHFAFALEEQLPKTWYGTQEQYNNLEPSGDTTYYIYEDE